MKPLYFLLLNALVFSSAYAEPKTSKAPFLKPAEALAKMDIPEDFEVSVFAAEPDIGEPNRFHLR